MRTSWIMFTLVTLSLAGCKHERLRRDLESAISPETAAEELTQATPAPAPRPPQPPPLPVRSVFDTNASANATVTTPTSHPVSEPAATRPEIAPGVTDDASADLRQFVAESRKKVDGITDFECKLTKREVVAGKSLSQDEIVYRFRTKPLGVYMKVVSETGQGRELLYVSGSNNNRIAVITGKGDSAIAGAGFRTNIDVDSRDATKRSRYKITDAGFSRTVAGIERLLSSPAGAQRVKMLGPVRRAESSLGLAGIEVTLTPGDDPLLPRGGTRRVYFGAEPGTATHLLPILVETRDSDGREVEFYHFHDLKLPATLPESAWDPAKLGKS